MRPLAGFGAGAFACEAPGLAPAVNEMAAAPALPRIRRVFACHQPGPPRRRSDVVGGGVPACPSPAPSLPAPSSSTRWPASTRLPRVDWVRIRRGNRNRSRTDRPDPLQAADPIKGPRPSLCAATDCQRHKRSSTSSGEGMAPMQWPGTTGVLEGLAGVPSGTELRSRPGSFASAELPCRDDPELFFAESPEDVEFAKSLCGSCAAQDGLPCRGDRARGAMGRLGRRAVPAGRDCPAQAAAGTSAQGRGSCLSPGWTGAVPATKTTRG